MYSTQVNILKVTAFALLVAGCAQTSGFRFPVEQSDIANGRQAFIDQRCHQCHNVAGEEFPSLAGEAPVQLTLAGESSTAKSYGELVTAIINPNHFISDRYREQLRPDATVPLESPMIASSIDNMTVRQLLDIVAFLHSRYGQRGDYGTGT